MDSYGVVPIWDHLLSIPGMLFYLVVAALFVFIIWRLSDGYFRFTKFVILSISSIIFWTLALIELGLWFYVKA
jgi:hypothetical protein